MNNKQEEVVKKINKDNRKFNDLHKDQKNYAVGMVVVGIILVVILIALML